MRKQSCGAGVRNQSARMADRAIDMSIQNFVIGWSWLCDCDGVEVYGGTYILSLDDSEYPPARRLDV